MEQRIHFLSAFTESLFALNHSEMLFSSSVTMENNILTSACSKNRFVFSENIIGSSTDELGRSLTKKKRKKEKKKAVVLVLSTAGHHKECSECLFEDHDLTKYTVFYLLGSCGTRQD